MVDAVLPSRYAILGPAVYWRAVAASARQLLALALSGMLTAAASTAVLLHALALGAVVLAGAVLSWHLRRMPRY